MCYFLSEGEQEAERISIRTDRVRTGLSLSHQTLSEEVLQQCREV